MIANDTILHQTRNDVECHQLYVTVLTDTLLNLCQLLWSSRTYRIVLTLEEYRLNRFIKFIKKKEEENMI